MAEPTETSSPRRLAILEAALEVFARYGFKKTSMDDLADAVERIAAFQQRHPPSNGR